MPVSLASTSASSMHGALVPIGYVAISGSPTSAVVFSNIPQGYQDLKVVISAQKTSGSYDSFFAINNDFTSNTGSRTVLSGDGSSASSSRRTNDSTNYFSILTSSTGFATVTIDILNYANTSTYKTILFRGAQDLNGSGQTYLNVSLKKLTSAVTSLVINSNDGNYSVGSTFELFGIRTVGQ